jgi:hypothetical protein
MLPFEGFLILFSLAQAVLHGTRLSIPSRVSEFYKHLIESCWRADPDTRPTFAEIVSEPERFKLVNCDGVKFDEYRRGVLKM